MIRIPHHIRNGDSIFFNYGYRPIWIIVNDYVSASGDTSARKHQCHWAAALNPHNEGLLVLDDTSIHESTTVTTNTEAYDYALPELYAGGRGGFGLHTAPYDAGPGKTNRPTGTDSLDFVQQPYRYHTIAMEYLPHEVRMLYDSVVVWRWPDRMIPPSSPYGHWVEMAGRYGIDILPGEFDADDMLAHPSDNGRYTRDYFLSHLSNPGFFDGAAHHRLDYVRVYDLPSAVVIPGLPQ